MKRIFRSASLIALLGILAFTKATETVTLETETGSLQGTLLVPDRDVPLPVALIIAGSGPTDRDGNNPIMRNDALKMLAAGLAKHGIASLRYDKRGVGESAEAGMQEADLRFENFVADARGWISLLEEDRRFSQIIVIGHSEGALVGMLASQDESVDRFVSVAGAGVPANVLIRRQLNAQPPMVLQQAAPILQKLESGVTTEEVPQMLLSLFRPSVQPYLISWFAYDPAKEIARIDKPVLIIQGTTDIQVTVGDAESLAHANAGADIQIVEGMNHILKEAPEDRIQNIATYSQPDLPLKDGLVQSIAEFILR